MLGPGADLMVGEQGVNDLGPDFQWAQQNKTVFFFLNETKDKDEGEVVAEDRLIFGPLSNVMSGLGLCHSNISIADVVFVAMSTGQILLFISQIQTTIQTMIVTTGLWSRLVLILALTLCVCGRDMTRCDGQAVGSMNSETATQQTSSDSDRRTSSDETWPYNDPTRGGTRGTPTYTGSACNENAITLNIIGLFAMSGMYPAGIAYLPAALLAVNHINCIPNILPGYKLKINAHNTNCEESKGLDAFYSEVYNKGRTSIMTLGGTCSPVTESVAPVARMWGMLMISYSSVSPRLSDKSIFPSFFRVTSPEQHLTIGRAAIFKEAKWKRVHVIYENYNVFSTLNEIMKQDLKSVGVNVESSEMFTNDPSESVKSLGDKDARIIIGNMYEDKARQVVCAAYNLEVYKTKVWYKRVVWFFPSFFDRHWMDVNDTNINCTSAQIREVIGKYFSISSQALWKGSIDNVTYLGVTPQQFKTLYKGQELYNLSFLYSLRNGSAVEDDIPKEFKANYTFYSDGTLYNQHRAAEAYDAVWALALALNNTLTYLIQTGDSMRLEDFSYNNTRFYEIIHEAMRNVSFNAVSGPFFFNKAGERTPDIEIYQFDNENPPVDGIQIQTRTLRINVYLRFCFWVLASVGIIISMGLLEFNIINKSHRIVKMSSPRMNNVILVGCMMSYTTIFMLDIEGDADQAACIMRTFTMVLSFSLTFGALFAKTWRVYEIFTAGHKVLNTRMLRDSSLFLIVALLVVINSIILIGWMIGSPQVPTLVNISTTLPTVDSDIEYINQFQRCDSQHRVQFIWTLIAIQGVVILFGTFLAIQTRKVSFPELNDSKWIALCIYNVVVLGPVGVVVVMATEEKPEINYALESSMIFLVTTMTQSLIFVPKILDFKQHNRSMSTDVELQLHGIKKILSFLCMTTSVKKHLVSEGSSASLEGSQHTQEVDISYESESHIGVKHHNKMRIPLGKSKSLSPAKTNPRPCQKGAEEIWPSARHCQKGAEEIWPSVVVAHISYRSCDEPSSRSESNLSLTTSETTKQCIEDEGPSLHEALGSQVKPWKSLTTIPVLYSTLEQDITLVRNDVLTNLKMSTRFGLRTTWMKNGNKLTQNQIDNLWKQLKEII
ncbi:hypothetical protein Btru_049497 [Bulinus truncatus]|nr:hypothetical protein Btru_049497 [Bulinus truncatus]